MAGWNGSNGNDTYSDTSGVNDMDGGDGNDRLYGLDGNDVFHIHGSFSSFSGFDYFSGGSGYNRIAVDTSYTHINLNILSADDNINEINGFAAPPSADSATRIQLDWLSGVGSTLDLSNTQFITNIASINGSPWGDLIIGNGQPITIRAWGGNDVIGQSTGTDIVDGGFGYDTYYADRNTLDYQNQHDDGSGVLKLHIGTTWAFSDNITGGLIVLSNVEKVVFADGTVLSSTPPDPLADTDTAPEQLAENTTNGATVGLTAHSTDAEDGAALTYSLDSNAGGRFAIDAASGVVTVANGALIDYETAANHAITVRATDSSGQYVTQAYTIQVLDGNDPPRCRPTATPRPTPSPRTPPPAPR